MESLAADFSACVCARVRACACVRACVRVCVGPHKQNDPTTPLHLHPDRVRPRYPINKRG